jgi:hypothetical protein
MGNGPGRPGVGGSEHGLSIGEGAGVVRYASVKTSTAAGAAVPFTSRARIVWSRSRRGITTGGVSQPMGTTEPIHESDPDQAPDSAFVPGELHHLVPGITGRMLDTRRTPVAIGPVDPDLGTFEVEVLAFEDRGARWLIEVERVSHFQFPLDAPRADVATVAALAEAVDRFTQALDIPIDPRTRVRTRARLRDEELRATGVLGDAPRRIDLAGRFGDDSVQHILLGYLAARGLTDLETKFAERYASNPSSGELVKGHEIVIARLGLVPYHGTVVRDPRLFADGWSEERRAEHVVARLGFVRAMLRGEGHDSVWLYRGLTADGPLGVPPARTFVSTTFDRAVAESIAGRGPTTVVSVLTGQLVSVDRVFMTFIETAALNRVYHEAEAILLADRRNRAF